ncbi:MAG: hypothetical protein RQ966_11270 [Acetobacteraceae bacterium]|nr:hypothetical protein [Acetobacteraceae bacterium]
MQAREEQTRIGSRQPWLDASHVTPENLTQWIAQPEKFLSLPLGSNGYVLPSANSLTIVDAQDAPSSRCKLVEKQSKRTNYVATCDTYAPSSPIRLSIYGDARNNVVIFCAHCDVFGELKIYGSGNIVILGGGAVQSSFLTIWLKGDCNLLYWGDRSTSNGTTINLDGAHNSIIVGEDCMFAKATNLRNTDEHGIFDVASFEHLNPPRDVHLEPHVWIGPEALIGKGATIGFGSIVASKSVITHAIPRFSLGAGVPATVKRRGVSWDRPLQPRPENMRKLRSWFEQFEADHRSSCGSELSENSLGFVAER